MNEVQRQKAHFLTQTKQLMQAGSSKPAENPIKKYKKMALTLNASQNQKSYLKDQNFSLPTLTD